MCNVEVIYIARSRNLIIQYMIFSSDKSFEIMKICKRTPKEYEYFVHLTQWFCNYINVG